MAVARSGKYGWVTSEAFDAKLAELLNEMDGGAILQIPGVYEAVSEELNNEVLEALEADRDVAQKELDTGVQKS